ncbi:Gmad2 immunoglobulin-like domain-containing protein [Neobacillus cucumis]|uniref:Gmad2 immunoglobulin-like domain-containing protein n=1 Tax=Neobacillus cucumis TaxID=1740721 RepID=UPI002E20B5FB|nr:Gmad2 immunoglobulin-like domain-containing protein [Neobacillus cucumis]
MKKITYFIGIVTVAIGLAACNQSKAEAPKQEKPTSQESNQTPNQERPTPPSQEKPPIPEKPTSPVPENKVYENKVFKDVVVTESGDKIILTGKAQVFEGVFQYTLYDGNTVVVENHYQTDGAPAWGEFEITFDKKQISSDQIKLELFVYSAKDGSKENTLEIIIPKPQ